MYIEFLQSDVRLEGETERDSKRRERNKERSDAKVI